MSTTPTTLTVSLAPGADHGKLLVSRDGITHTVTTLRPADRATAAVDLLTTLVATRPNYLLWAAARHDGDLTGIRRTVLGAYADGLAGRPEPDAHNRRFEAPALAHQLGVLLADADAPVHAAVRSVVGELFDHLPDVLVVAEVADYTDDIAARVDVTEVLADADAAELGALLAAATGTAPTDTAVLFDHLTGDALTTLERVVSRIDATGSPTYVTISAQVARRWLTSHRPEAADLLADRHDN